MKRILLTILGAAALGGPATAAEADAKELAIKAQAILKQYCQRCHHGEGSDGGDWNILDHKYLTTATDIKPMVVAGKPDESRLLERVEKNNMPPRKVRERPSEADRAVLRKWIEAGAPAAPARAEQARTYISQKAILTGLRDDLRKADKADRYYIRYFTLTHLHNNPKVSEADLRLYRAALSKALNSLSWKASIVLPRAIDKEQTIFAIDIRDLDWDRNQLWRAIMKLYPYGLKYTVHPDPELQKLDDDIEELTDCELSYLRADWFVATATRPPLYHVLLRLPKNAYELEKMLKVNIEANFGRDRLARAGFAASGVSGQNRLVDRHDAVYGVYWKSYDFKEGNKLSNLPQYPLGPCFHGNPFERQAFKHDGGEIIFSLPNGLQGYLLVNGKDERIDVGPIEVVSDALKTSGTPEIVNGVSCIACHKHGPIGFKDQIREGTAVLGEARRKVQRLYPIQKEMDSKLKEDEDRFMRALEKTVGSYLQVGEDKDKPLKDFAEPVGEVARLYRLADVDLATIAYELDLEKPEELRAVIKGNKKLRELGLAPLLRDGGTIKRHEWESVHGTSLMQKTAREMERGMPFRLLK